MGEYVPQPMARQILEPYTIPGVQRLSQYANGPLVRPSSLSSLKPEPLYQTMRGGLSEVFRGLDEHTLAAIAQAAAMKAREAEEEQALGFYREPFWYGVYVGAQGVAAAAIPAGATSPGGANKIRMESGSNFEAYYGVRWSQDTVTGLINNPRSFRSRVFYAGSKGVTSEDENAPVVPDQMRNQNLWGSAVRPARYVWPRVFPADSSVEHEVLNDEANPANFQLAWFGNKVYCGKNPRKLVTKAPYRREPFSYGISFNAVAANVMVPGNVQMLEHADFELLYITQDSPDGNAGDFECLLKEADGGNKGLSNIPIRRDAGYGTIERPTILTYPRYYVRGSRILAEFTNRNFAGAAQSFQLGLHGNLII